MAPRRLLVSSWILAWSVLGGVTPVAAAVAPPPPPPPPKIEVAPSAPAAGAVPPPAPGSGGGMGLGARNALVPPPPGAKSTAAPSAAPEVADMSPTTDLSRTWGFSREKREIAPRYTSDVRPVVLANPLGFYSGVSVMGQNPPPASTTQTAVPGQATLTWIGFEGLPKGSRVFAQLSSGVEVRPRKVDQLLEVRLVGAGVSVVNNTRPLDLTYHRTPAQSVTPVKDGTDTVLRIRLKRDATFRVQQLPAPNGYVMVLVDLDEVAVAPRAGPPAATAPGATR